MNEEYFIASNTFRKLFQAELLALASIAVVLIPVLGWIAAPIMVLVACGFEIFALYDARYTHTGFETAFYVTIAQLVVTVISIFLPEEGFLKSLVDIVSNILGAAMVYYVCSAGSELLEEKGDGYLSDRAKLIWKLYIGCTVVTVLNAVVGSVPVLGWLTTAANVVAVIVSLVAYVLLIIFYNQASKSLVQ